MLNTDRVWSVTVEVTTARRGRHTARPLPFPQLTRRTGCRARKLLYVVCVQCKGEKRGEGEGEGEHTGEC